MIITDYCIIIALLLLLMHIIIYAQYNYRISYKGNATSGMFLTQSQFH